MASRAPKAHLGLDEPNRVFRTVERQLHGLRFLRFHAG
jgi:hypothetical protein